MNKFVHSVVKEDMNVLFLDNTAINSNGFFINRLRQILEDNNAIFTRVRTYDEVQRTIATNTFDGAILSGSDETLSAANTKPEYLSKNALVLQSKIPVLGICFGMQVMAVLRGGTICRLREKCTGSRAVHLTRGTLLSTPRRTFIDAHHANRDAVDVVPPGFTVVAYVECGAEDRRKIPAIMENVREKHFGVQFHPEGNPSNDELLVRFLEICAAKGRTDMSLLGSI